MNKKLLAGLGVLGFIVILAVIIICVVVLKQPDDAEVPTDDPVVTTATAGRITGRTLDGVKEFLNIKYAHDPVGELRFQPPVPLNRSADEDVDATNDETVICVWGSRFVSSQPVGVEECLVLSVRVPVESSQEGKLPIVVWIHGGELKMGYGSQPGYSFDRATTKKMGVMTVNINYRLGFMGWAALAGISPNNGLRDMITALNWVKDNGAAFGGDPDDVTVVGESAGATSILALLRSPLADGLFNRAVSLSPAPEMDTKENVEEIQKAVWLPPLGCDANDDDADLLKCLLEADIAKFAPVVSEDYLSSGYGYSDFPLRYGADNKVAEAYGLLFQDGEVISRDTLESSVTLILSNLVEEVGLQVATNVELESSWDKASPIITSLLPAAANTNITADDLVSESGPYKGLESSGIWNKLVTDMRSTCPTNTLAAENSETNIVRALITHHQVSEDTTYPAFHMYDTHALFGFNPEGYWGTVLPAPTDAERGFQDVMIDLVMNETGGSGGHVVLGRTEDGGAERREEKGMPREETCEWLAANGLSEYGWMN